MSKRVAPYVSHVFAMEETPIFNPKFPFWCISFSQMTKMFCSKASPFLSCYLLGSFYIFDVPETIIFKVLSVQAITSYSLEFTVPECPILVPETPIFTLELVLELPIFYFVMCGECPPPPPPPPRSCQKLCQLRYLERECMYSGN